MRQAKSPGRGTTQPEKPGEGGVSDDDLEVIREQTREILVLLRQLIEMLLPRGDPDGPKLEDLLAALIGLQRETLAVVRQTSADVSALLDRRSEDDHDQRDHRCARANGASAC
jgi:hypothetical protein